MNKFPHQKYFTKSLLDWNGQSNNREMPWKGEQDPYKIWLSEIILQQTRVDQGLNYYKRFIAVFPTVNQLANAPETSVFKLWEGLGYYSRCKNLLITARYIDQQLGGRFPATYEAILSLKGIGPYTAAAIGSFAFNLPHAVVDGNVFRVLARYFGIYTAIDTTAGQKLFASLAADLLDKKRPGIYNQALMDFGAVVCKPQLPLCEACVMNKNCKARLKGKVHELPVKEKSILKRSRWFYYIIVEYNEGVYVHKRKAGDIWENLYEFVLTETSTQLSADQPICLYHIAKTLGIKAFELVHTSAHYKQLLTHQTIRGRFFHIKIARPLAIKTHEIIPKKAIDALPFPKFISTYLKDKNVSLNLYDTRKNQHSIELIPTT